MNLTFSTDKPFIDREFTDRVWMSETGLDPDRLHADCRSIWQRLAGQSIQLRRAQVTEYILDHAQTEILPFELFADQLRGTEILSTLTDEHYTQTEEAIRPQLAETDPAQNAYTFVGTADFGHTCPDWRAILSLGLPGLLCRLKEARKNASAEQTEFFDCCIIVYEATLRAVCRMADAAEGQAGVHPRLHMVAENLRAISLHAPETLYQALQLSFIVYLVQHDIEKTYLRSLGRFDLLYQPFYEADLAAGRLTRETAKELLQYYMYRWNARNVVANIPITLCGTDEQGRAVGSDFTLLLLEAYGELNVISPKFQIRTTPGTPGDILEYALSLVRKGSSSFVFCNDEVIERGLCALSHTPEDARDYVMIGCYESSSMGRELACTCNGYINVPKAVEYALTGGVDLLSGEQIGLPTPRDFPTFEAFEHAVHEQLRFFADQCMRRVALIETLYPAVCSSAFLSATMENCLNRGCDAYYGGAKYNHSSINPFGWATAADSMAAVRYLVFEEKRVSIPQLADILANNWEGHELLRRTVIKRAPKYGRNDPQADLLAQRLFSTVANQINGRPNSRGGTFRTGGFSISFHYGYGKHTGASANGRLARKPLSKNLGATLGMDTEGATAMILSSCCFDGSLLPNGTVLDLVLHESAVAGREGLSAMTGLARTFMKKGGIAVQFNVLSADTLRRAQAHPEQYPTLQVRLCGWNVLFANLNKEEQDDLIAQAEASS